LEALWFLEGSLISKTPSGLNGFSHLFHLGELDHLFFDPYIIVDEQGVKSHHRVY
jgi:hypothetical protein